MSIHMTVADMPVPYVDGCVKAKCVGCDTDLWISPDVQFVMADRYCMPCCAARTKEVGEEPETRMTAETRAVLRNIGFSEDSLPHLLALGAAHVKAMGEQGGRSDLGV